MLHIPLAWRQSAATIRHERWRVILLLGCSDAGKSSYGRFLAGELAQAGQRVAIVDADIGQKTVGPPTAVTLAHIEGTGEPATAEAFYFVGSPDPVGRMLPLVVGTARLVGMADASFVIVDTTGYIEGAGRVLKSYKIDAVRPDVIVAIERRKELEAILHPYRARPMLRIRPSRKARSRDRWERDLAREMAFAAYFEAARRLELSLDDVIFQRSLLFSGEPMSLSGTLYAERTVEGVVTVAESPVPGIEVAKCIKPGFERSLLCGVADERNYGTGLAIIEAIDFGRRTLSLISPVPRERLSVLQLGDLYLGADGRELGRVDRAGF